MSLMNMSEGNFLYRRSGLIFFIFVFETGSYHVALDGLELTM